MNAKQFILAATITALCVACTQPDHAKKILEDQGYTDVRMDGYDWLNCSKDDVYHDKFTAKSPAGKKVSGVVCAGLLFKGATIRLD
jgi:hypothetical protein